MRVLVTRPRGSGLKTAERLVARGHSAVTAPLIVARHDGAAVARALSTPHAALALTSAEAVRALRQAEIDLEPHRDTPVYAVGRATAQAATAAGFRHVTASGGTGIALAATVLSARQTLEGPLLYLAGSPRSPDFEALLAAADLPLVAVTVYCMETAADAQAALAAAFAGGPVDAVLFHSRHTAEVYFRLLPAIAPAQPQPPAYLCFSDKVAEAVPRTDAPRVFVAQQPEEAELLALLDHCQ